MKSSIWACLSAEQEFSFSTLALLDTADRVLHFEELRSGCETKLSTLSPLQRLTSKRWVLPFVTQIGGSMLDLGAGDSSGYF